MKALRFFLACILLCSIVPVSAQETMDEATLRRHMIMAEGKPPDSYRVDTHADSTLGIEDSVEFRRGTDYKESSERGPFHFEAGRFQGHEWDQDANGLTTMHEPDPARARPDAYTVTITRVTKPVEAWKYSRLNIRGAGSVEYVDPGSFRVLRREQISTTGTRTTLYDDFRTVDGFTVPYHVTTQDDAHTMPSESKIISLSPQPVTDEELAIPKSRDFVEFPAGSTAVDIPTDFEMPHIYVRLMIAGRGLDFVLDSGAQSILLDTAVAHELGLTMYGKSSTVNARREDFSEALVPEIRIGDLVMRNVAVSVGNFEWNERVRTKVVGLLGFDFFRALGITIDYSAKRVSVVPAGTYTPPAMTPDSDILPMRVGTRWAYVPTSINGAIADRMLVDTGAATDFMLFDYFLRRYPEAVSTRVAYKAPNPVYYLGVGGRFEAHLLRLDDVDIGRFHLKQFDAVAVDSIKSYAQNADGVIGPGILEHFIVGFDYEDGRLYLIHNKGQ